ncbi:MAG: hypothetical protein OXN89_19225 [Bryobacterales bacterium]|nr:hypothetical protein [Bryobacterales bacterium]
MRAVEGDTCAGIAGLPRRNPRCPTRWDGNSDVAPDRMQRRQEACHPSGLWVADTSPVPTLGGLLRLTTVVSGFSRKNVDLGMRARQT